MAASLTNIAELQQKTKAAGQEHLLQHWRRLSAAGRRQLARQIESIDFQLIAGIYANLIQRHETAPCNLTLEPAEVISLVHQQNHPQECAAMQAVGAELLRRGQVAAVLVAGGQGSRLGFEGPKGAFVFGALSGKSLFQLHAEKILAATRRYRAAIPWYIMTSEANHEETKAFFAQHNFFGLPAEEVFFFKQGMMPAVDEDGKIILEAPDSIFMNPDGHGGTLQALAKSGALADMQHRGITEIFYFQVDNVLLHMCDPLFIGYHAAAQAEMSAKVCGKRDAHEKIGVIGKRNGRLTVIEYSDMSDIDKETRNPDGSLTYNSGSIAIHMLRVDFVARLVHKGQRLPWHIAHKKIPFINAAGELIKPEQPNGYKFETFIFDALGDARHSILLEVNRQVEFSPIKNATGVDSPEAARRDYYNLYAGWLEQCGVNVPRDGEGWPKHKIEISPLFALDATELQRKLPADFKMKGDLYLS